MEVTAFKWLALSSLFVMAMVGGLLPLRFKQSRASARYLSIGNMFAGGIFLGGGLMHLLPEAHENYETAMASVDSDTWPDTMREFPVAFFLCGLGFFAVLMVEESALAWTANKQRKMILRDKQQRKTKEVEENAAAAAGASATAAGAIEASKSQGVSGAPGSTLGTPLLSDSAAAASSSSAAATVAVPHDDHYDGGGAHGHGHAHAHGDGGHAHSHGGGGGGHLHGHTAAAAPADPERAQEKADRQLAKRVITGLAPRVTLRGTDSPPASPKLTGAKGPRRRLPARGPLSGGGGGAADDPSAATTGTASAYDSDGGGGGDGNDSDAEVSVSESDVYHHHHRHDDHDGHGHAHDQHHRHHHDDDADGHAHGHGHSHGDAGSGHAHAHAHGSAVSAVAATVAAANGTSTAARAPTVAAGGGNGDAKRLENVVRHTSTSDADGTGNNTNSSLSAAAATTATIAALPPTTATIAGGTTAAAAAATDDDHHAHGHGHGHGHGGDDHDHFALDPAVASSIVAYILVLALSFHSVFEGIAFGTQTDMASSVALYVAIAAHTPLAGFALGVSLVKAKSRVRVLVSCITLFSATVPAGTMLGLLFSELLEGSTLDLVSSCFQAFSSGTFLFVALGEIIPKELATGRDKAAKLALCLLGFAGMSVIKLFDH